MIKYYPFNELSPDLKSELQQYIHEEFGNVPFVQERVWAQPDWVFIMYDGGTVASFYHVVLRQVTMDSRSYLVAGINNVITSKNYRGRGYSSQLLRKTEGLLFGLLKCDYGLLLCADALVPFYSRLNWYATDATLYYEQPSGKHRYDSNVMFLAPTECESTRPLHIDLNGLPW